MSYRGLSADPEGLLVFDEPTSVQVHDGSGYSSVSVEVLPYNALLDEQEHADRGVELWLGDETYYLPEGATYTTITDLATVPSRIEVATYDSIDRQSHQAVES
jgi:hypothetical protein